MKQRRYLLLRIGPIVLQWMQRYALLAYMRQYCWGKTTRKVEDVDETGIGIT